MIKKTLPALLAIGLAMSFATPLTAQTTGSVSKSEQTQSAETYSTEEILVEGHRFFGNTSRGLAKAVEYVFQRQGEPSAYIVGEEGAAAFVGGLRYGEGTIYFKDGRKEKIFWQGPSMGFDFGANGSRTMVLVYNSNNPEDLHDRFGGVECEAASEHGQPTEQVLLLRRQQVVAPGNRTPHRPQPRRQVARMLGTQADPAARRDRHGRTRGERGAHDITCQT